MDAKGKTSTYYTYDGYYAEEDRRKIRDYRRKVERRTFTSAFLSGLFAYYVTHRQYRHRAAAQWAASASGTTQFPKRAYFRD